MSTATVEEWIICTDGKTCPVCGLENMRCLTRDNLAVCTQVCDRTDRAQWLFKEKVGSGWLYRQSNSTPAALHLESMQRTFAGELTEDRADDFAARYNISPITARNFGMGFNTASGAYVVPLRNHLWQITCFWAMKLDDPKASGYFGGMGTTPHYQGFFGQEMAPDFLKDIPTVPDGRPLTLLCPRGLKCALSAADNGYSVLGRPTLAENADELCRLLAKYPIDLLIVPDRESEKGWEGALFFAQLVLAKWPVRYRTMDMKNPQSAQLRLLLFPKMFKDGTPLTNIAQIMDRGFSIDQLIKDAPICDQKLFEKLEAEMRK